MLILVYYTFYQLPCYFFLRACYVFLNDLRADVYFCSVKMSTHCFFRFPKRCAFHIWCLMLSLF